VREESPRDQQIRATARRIPEAGRQAQAEPALGTTRPARSGPLLSDFDYELADHVIASEPAEPRPSARLLVSLADESEPIDAHVRDLPRFLRPGDLLVLNETRVLPARLMLEKETGGGVEVLLLEPLAGRDGEWEALVRPSRRVPPGTRLYAESPVGEPGEGKDSAGETANPTRAARRGTSPSANSERLSPEEGASHEARRVPLVEVGPWPRDDQHRERSVRLLDPTAIARYGRIPIPPYLRRLPRDPERYQTVYSRREGSVAAPTAGLHFTTELLRACERAGARIATLDLAVGIGTFLPITVEEVEEHTMHEEAYAVPLETYRACEAAERVVAVGTTTLRALETVAAGAPLVGRTDLYVHGSYPFRIVDVLLTNFHLPASSLLILVDSFYGPGWRSLYARAIRDGYRVGSFGDAMLLGRGVQR